MSGSKSGLKKSYGFYVRMRSEASSRARDGVKAQAKDCAADTRLLSFRSYRLDIERLDPNTEGQEGQGANSAEPFFPPE